MIPGMFAAGAVRGGGAGAGDPYWSNVVALLHFDGPGESTDFVDETGRSWSAAGGAQLDTSWSAFGPSSGLFMPAGYVVAASSDAWVIGPSDYTAEAVVRVSDLSERCIVFSRREATGGATGWQLIIQPDGLVWASGRAGPSQAVINIMSAPGVIQENQEKHLALVRHGGTWMIFAGGVLVASGEETALTLDNARPLYIGHEAVHNRHFRGNIDEVRITKGVARYTSNFTPPEAAFPDFGPDTPIWPGQTVDIFVVAGQSNAEGRGVAAQSPVVPKGSGAWWDGSGYALLKDPVGGALSGSPWPSFANAYYLTTGRSVLIVSTAEGATGLLPGAGAGGDWSPSGTHRSACVDAANAAVSHVSADPNVSLGSVCIYWQQGESDANNYNGTTVTDTLYQAAQEDLFGYFFSNVTGLDSILVSELGNRTTPDPNYVLIRNAQNAAVTATANVHLAFTGAKDFPGEGKMIDAVHYDQAGLNELGEAVAIYAAGLIT